MKKCLFLFSGLAVLMMVGCSENEPPTEPSTTELNARLENSKESSVNDYANDFLSQFKNGTRSNNAVKTANVYPLLNNNDTIAYIANYEDNNAFVIVSNTSPAKVLAFSTEECFPSYNREAYDKISAVISNTTSIQSTTPNRIAGGYPDFSQYDSVPPVIKAKISQRAPYNKYVSLIKEDAPVGCVPTAISTAMLYSKDRVKLLGRTYYLKSIRQGFGLSISIKPSIKPAGLEAPDPIYPNDAAIDNMALFMCNVGIGLGIDYSVSSGFGDDGDVCQFVKGLGFKVNPDLKSACFANFDVKEVVNLLRNNYIIYLGVDDINPTEPGHAVVSDGCYYKLDFKGNIESSYLHIDWGWGGKANGYYTSDIYIAGGQEWVPWDYFGILREI